MRSLKQNVILGLLVSSLATLGISNAEARSNARGHSVQYSYLGARYLFQDLDKFNCSQDGVNLYGSLDIADGWFAKADFSDVGGDKGCGSSTFRAGGGYHAQFDARMSAYGTLSFESTSPDYGDSDSGLVLAAGVRGFLTQQLEGNVEIFHSTTFDGTTGIHGLLAYWFTTNVSGTFDLGLASEVTTFAVGARLNF